MNLKEISDLIFNFTQEKELSDYKPAVTNHAENTCFLTSIGYTKLAADHLLFPQLNENLVATISEVIRILNINFERCKLKNSHDKSSLEKSVLSRSFSYDVLLEIVLNFLGLESRWLSEEQNAKSIKLIYVVLKEWEEKEIKELGDAIIAKSTVQKILDGMKIVQKGVSIVTKTAEIIEKEINGKIPITLSFLESAKNEIQRNIYFKMVKRGVCKFGNDYALGLRWLRHLGFEQVSTNPPLASIAYQDDKALIERFKREVSLCENYQRWKKDPKSYADEITMFATLNALWDNLYVFRPIFFLLQDSSGGGVVSFQLNPNIAHLVKESIEDVFSAFQYAEKKLKVYDEFLLAGYKITESIGRPNMVIKVSASNPAAREIAKTINSYGFGSNITVIFSVAQEVTMILEELEGMANAIKKGIKPTQLYMTNMGGRLESHLREIKLEELFGKLKEKIGEKKALERILKLAEANKTKEKVDECKTYEDKVITATRYLNGQKVIDGNIIDSLSDVFSKEELLKWEDDIEKSGTLVARRVWNIFFSSRNYEKWVNYLVKKYELNEESARFIMSRINYLPASKRRPADTLLTLASTNMVHTEFPNHQEAVRQVAEKNDFNLLDFYESIKDKFSPTVVEKLNEISDFRKAFELNDELIAILKDVGIEGDFGNGGLKPLEWENFGSVRKTISEFSDAYNKFKDYILKEFPC